jgi:hypothetical protein
MRTLNPYNLSKAVNFTSLVPSTQFSLWHFRAHAIKTPERHEFDPYCSSTTLCACYRTSSWDTHLEDALRAPPEHVKTAKCSIVMLHTKYPDKSPTNLNENFNTLWYSTVALREEWLKHFLK